MRKMTMRLNTNGGNSYMLCEWSTSIVRTLKTVQRMYAKMCVCFAYCKE